MAVLKRDPTRTTALRKRFSVDMRKRFLVIRRAVLSHVYIDDAYGLEPETTGLVGNVREFEFLTDAGKVRQFRAWLQEQINTGVLSVEPGLESTPWLSTYVESAYKKGVVRAYVDAKGFDADEQAFFLDAFSSRSGLAKIELVSTRAFEGLKGITHAMSNDMSRIFADGLAHGRSPRVVAKELADSVAGITKKRALVLARTEIVNAHSEGQLDSFEKLGVETLGVDVEFSTAGDGRVCQVCASLEGQTFTTKTARGVIPVHPNCRCAWIPAI